MRGWEEALHIIAKRKKTDPGLRESNFEAESRGHV